MAKIHPSAVVDKDAQLADDVVVGPNCVVGARTTIGAGTVLYANVIVGEAVQIGRDNRFYPNCTIGYCPQVLGFDQSTPVGRLEIGDRNCLRENVTVHPSRREDQATTIGNENFLMISSHIGHDCTVADKTVLSNLVQIGGHCKIETGAWLSGMAATHQFVTVGAWSFVTGLCGLTRDAPPFLIVSGHYPPKVRGVNKRGMQRAGLDESQQQEVFDAYKRLFRRGGTLLENVRTLAAEDTVDENVRSILDSIKRSSQHRFGRYLETLREH